MIDAKKNPNNVIRHVLCAETDQERDQWVDALMLYVGKELSESKDSADRDRSGRKLPEIQKLSATPIKDLSSKGNEKLLLNQEAYERQQHSAPPSLSNQHLQGRGGGSTPQSPVLQGGTFDERQSSERPSTEGQHGPSSKGSYNGNNSQQHPSRSQSSQSLPQDEV